MGMGLVFVALGWILTFVTGGRDVLGAGYAYGYLFAKILLCLSLVFY